jgi:hypothetical protein
MNEVDPSVLPGPASQRRFSGLQLTLAVLAAVLLTATLTLWAASAWLFPSELRTVRLTAPERQALDGKLQRLGVAGGRQERDQEWLRPAPYEEQGAPRTLVFSERELNALIAEQPDLAGRVAVALTDDLASVRVLVPLDPDFPLLGGRTLRLSAGAELSYAAGRPRVLLRGVSVMGVPVPGAWLGNLKNVDLVERYGGEPGFWQAFAQGVEAIRIEGGELRIELCE